MRNIKTILYIYIFCCFILVAKVGYLEYQTTRPYDIGRLLSAKQEANTKPLPELIEDLVIAAGGYRELGRLIKAEPSTLRRLSEGKTDATPLMSDNIKALFIEFRARKNSWSTLRWAFRCSRFDPYTAQYDPLREQSVVTEEGSEQY